jgi:hypothetical protein
MSNRELRHAAAGHIRQAEVAPLEPVDQPRAPQFPTPGQPRLVLHPALLQAGSVRNRVICRCQCQGWNECPGAFQVTACHDALVVECDAGQAEAGAAWLRQAMVDGMAPFIAPVPVVVEVSVGRNWAR